MSTKQLKNKIRQSLEGMDKEQLESAYLILKELGNQKEIGKIKINSSVIDENIAVGIQQLNEGEGTDFNQFLNEMKSAYGKK